METHRFKVFGKLIHVARSGKEWQAFYPGEDGKRRAADFIIPQTWPSTNSPSTWLTCSTRTQDRARLPSSDWPERV